MPTKLALTARIAEELRVIGAGESLSADDSAKIEQLIDESRAYLIEEGYCYWADNDIPKAVMTPLAKYMAHQCAPVFDLTYDRGAEGFEELKRHTAKRANNEPVTADYF